MSLSNLVKYNSWHRIFMTVVKKAVCNFLLINCLGKWWILCKKLLLEAIMQIIGEVNNKSTLSKHRIYIFKLKIRCIKHLMKQILLQYRVLNFSILQLALLVDLFFVVFDAISSEFIFMNYPCFSEFRRTKNQKPLISKSKQPICERCPMV